MLVASRLVARLAGGRALSARPLSAAAARFIQVQGTRSRAPQPHRLLCAATPAASTATDKMATANGASVTAEEVEALRKQLEELQVGNARPPPHMRGRRLPPAAGIVLPSAFLAEQPPAARRRPTRRPR